MEQSDALSFKLLAFRNLVLSRGFEENLIQLYHSGKLRGHPHSGIGQEAIGVGSVMALKAPDMICPSLRAISSMLTKGVSAKDIMAEAFRTDNGPTQGRWLYHHISDPDKGVILGSAVVAASIPVAVGFALAAQMQETNQVVLSFFGDGATSRGDFHEAINFASVFNLPIVFICENNLYALSTNIKRQMRNENVADRAIGYGIPGVIADGSDVFDVYEKVKAAVELARQKKGPSLIECKTYRLRAHSEIDPDHMNRPAEELEHWRAKATPIDNCRNSIIAEFGEKVASELDKIEVEVTDELKAAVEYALASPSPAPETAATGVFALEKELR